MTVCRNCSRRSKQVLDVAGGLEVGQAESPLRDHLLALYKELDTKPLKVALWARRGRLGDRAAMVGRRITEIPRLERVPFVVENREEVTLGRR